MKFWISYLDVIVVLLSTLLHKHLYRLNGADYVSSISSGGHLIPAPGHSQRLPQRLLPLPPQQQLRGPAAARPRYGALPAQPQPSPTCSRLLLVSPEQLRTHHVPLLQS